MSRIGTVVLAFALVIAAVPVAPAAASVAPGSGAASTAEAQSDDQSEGAGPALSPGQQLTGVLGVQAAELEGEVETRTFDRAVERAETNTSRAQVLAVEIERIRTRLSEYQTELRELERAREQGEITEREYRVRVSHVAARVQALGRLAERTERVSGEMPLGLLEASGVNVTAAYAVGVETDEAAGGRVADIAVAVAGPETGAGFETERAPDRARGLITGLTRMLDQAEQIVDRADQRVPDDNERAVATIETARRYLEEAHAERDHAARAASDGEFGEAVEHAKRSRAFVRRAIVTAHRAERIAAVTDQAADQAASAIAYAERTLGNARQVIDRAESAGAGEDRPSAAMLDRARTHLTAAQRHLDAARSAESDGEHTRAMREARQSIASSELATREARAAAKLAAADSETEEEAREAIGDAEDRLADAERTVQRAGAAVDDDRQAVRALASARNRLQTARSTLDRASATLDDGDPEAALRLARESQSHAAAAIDAAENAIRLAQAADEREEADDRERTETETADRDRDDEQTDDDEPRRTERRSR